MVPEIRVSLFGYPRVECQGETVAIPRRKALALLAYLCVTQSHHSRDVLASLLWPEEESALHELDKRVPYLEAAVL